MFFVLLSSSSVAVSVEDVLFLLGHFGLVDIGSSFSKLGLYSDKDSLSFASLPPFLVAQLDGAAVLLFL